MSEASRWHVRAWDSVAGRMYYSSEDDGDDRFFFCIDDGRISGWRIEDGEEDGNPVGVSVEVDDPLMQSTGQTDCDGREIFEGDRVERIIEPKDRYEIKWGQCEFVMSSESEDHPLSMLPDCRIFRVVGSIHEGAK